MNEELISLFKKELEKVGGVFCLANNDNDVTKCLSDIIINNGYRNVSVNNNLSFKEQIFELSKNNNFKLIFNDSSKNNRELIQNLAITDVGISDAKYLIAETGSVVLISNENESRSISLLPETNIIIARATDIIMDLTEALLKLKSEENFSSSSCITVITGPSRTADIEKVLVTGVHGPKRLYVILYTNLK